MGTGGASSKCITDCPSSKLKHPVSWLKGFNNPVAYSLKYKIDLLLSAKSNSCFIQNTG